ncbi:hypothetical protein EJ03DRAFT_326592, partial [Teratosphaeria nubilosa]
MKVIDALEASSASYAGKVKTQDYGAFYRNKVLKQNPASEAYWEIRDLQARSNQRITGLLSVGAEHNRNDKQARKRPSAEPEWQSFRDPDQLLRYKANAEGFRYDRLTWPMLDMRHNHVDEYFDEMENSIRAWCAQQAELIDAWAERLVRLRRQRANTVRWEAYAGYHM